MQEGDWIAQRDACMRYYLRINPDELSDADWAKAWNGLVWVREQEAKNNG